MEDRPTAFNRVLIVDDDPTSCYLAKLTLEDMVVARHVDTRQLAQQGLQYIQQHCINKNAALEECPDLVLLDLSMPIMDGFDFLESLRQLGQDALIRAAIVVLTSSTNAGDRQRVEKFGVRGYLEKPITEQKVMSLLA